MKTKLVIFGITGDLAQRKLLPALDTILSLPEAPELEIIGVSRRNVDVADVVDGLELKSDLAKRLQVLTMDLASPDDYERLKDRLLPEAGGQSLMYLSVPSRAATQIADMLGQTGFGKENVKILFEKPFGLDFQSAQEMIAETHRYFREEQLYRIDHYLAKEMAQNLVVLREWNALFAHVWNSDVIECVEIVASEVLGIENRGEFYEQTGALRDVIQGHLMQLLALTILEIPSPLNWEDLPKLRHQAIASLRPADPAWATRAQYEGYLEDAWLERSHTETLASVTLESESPRWRGIPLILTAAKATNEQTTEIRVFLKKTHAHQTSRFVVRIQPQEGVVIDLWAKVPGPGMTYEEKHLRFNYGENMRLMDAYERVLLDAVESKRSLFASSDEVLASWRVLQPVLDSWGMAGGAITIYPRGSALADAVEQARGQ